MELPVRLTTAERESHPEFAKLLARLSLHICADGCSKSLKRDFEEVKAGLEHEKLKWLQYTVLYTELQGFLLDEQIREASMSTPASHHKFYKAVQESLTYAEIGDYVDCHPDPASQTTLLGLSKQDVHTANPHHKHLSAVQQSLVPEIESRLRHKCETILDFHQASSDIKPDGDKSSLAKYNQLPTLLENEKSHIAEQEKRLKQEKQKREKQFWQYYQALVESLETLEVLITKHRLETQSQCDTTTSNWLAARCDAMCLKIKMLELQLMCDTYHSAAVQALTKIRNNVDMAMLEAQHELSTTAHALKAYQAVGMGFDELVKEYTQLCDEIDNKKWAVKELRNSTGANT